MNNRRDFFKLAGCGLMAAGFTSLKAASIIETSLAKSETKELYKLGMAGYSLKEFNIDQSISMLQRLQIKFLSIKDFHLPLDSTKEKIDEVMGKFSAAGITVYAAGVIYMKTQPDVDRAFEYVKKMGIPMFIGVPSYDLISYTEKKVKEYNIKIAIHNHGPEDALYPSPEDVNSRIKDLDSRMGFCIDIGHTRRTGMDPSEALIKYGPRIYDLHVKDVDKIGKEGKTIEIGRGIIDFPRFIKTLREINYEGKASFEFEKDMKDPLPGLAESIGFYKGVMASVK